MILTIWYNIATIVSCPNTKWPDVISPGNAGSTQPLWCWRAYHTMPLGHWTGVQSWVHTWHYNCSLPCFQHIQKRIRLLASQQDLPERQTHPVENHSLFSLDHKGVSNAITLLTVRPVLRFVTRAKSATIVASSVLLRAVPTSLLRRATTPSLNRDDCFSSSGTGSLKDLVLDILIGSQRLLTQDHL